MLNAPNIFVLTGAGVSKPSGLATFRDPDGVWSRHRVEDVATPQALHENPTQLHQFYDEFRSLITSGSVQPNAAHIALARLEEEWPGGVTIVTQNIDDLHERAGSQNVIHMHGEALKARCSKCGHIRSWRGSMDTNDLCNVCEWEAELRPHVVLFGEAPLMMPSIHSALDACDLFVAIGSSLNVYPAASFVDQVRERPNTRTVELNLEPSARTEKFDESYMGDTTEIVPLFVSGLLASLAGNSQGS